MQYKTKLMLFATFMFVLAMVLPLLRAWEIRRDEEKRTCVPACRPYAFLMMDSKDRCICNLRGSVNVFDDK